MEKLGNSKTELLLKIFSQKEEDLGVQLANALSWSTDDLGMEIGIISQIQGETYTIKKFYPEASDLEAEQEFKLRNTYCSLAIKEDGVFSVADMANSVYKDEDCYQKFKLESYIGKPFHINGSLYGTINFSSSKPKKGGFSDHEMVFVELLSGWISSIIHRLKVEYRLREENRLYRLISTNSAELICMHELDGTYTYVSPSAKDLLGYSPQELMGENPYQLFHPDDLERITKESHEKARSGENYPSIQYRIRKIDNSYIWFDTSTQPVLDDNGEVVALQTTSRDISSKKRIDILFEQSQKMAKVGGWEYDLDSGRLYWTDEVYRIHEVEIGTKVSVEDAVNYYPEGGPREKIQGGINSAIETGESWDLETELVTANGKKLWVRAIGEAEYFEGKPVKLRGTFQDISAKKEYENQIESQLNQLTKLKETREKLYSIIAHDLKNSIFGITGFLDLLIEDLQTEEDLSREDMLEKLKLLFLSADHSYKMLENMLTWVRLQSGLLEITPEEFEIQAALETTLDLLTPSAERKGIKIEIKSIDNTRIFGEPNLIKTVLRNLINNAIKFSNSGDKILISIVPISNESISISVRDEGTGMNEDTIANLFNPNIRPRKKGTADEKGTGLGLILVQELLSLHNAHIKVESTLNKGSTFIVTLPVELKN